MKTFKFNIKINIGKIAPTLALGSLIAIPITLFNRTENHTSINNKIDLDSLNKLLTKLPPGTDWNRKELQQLSNLPFGILEDFLRSQRSTTRNHIDPDAALRTIARICHYATKTPGQPKGQFNKLIRICAARKSPIANMKPKKPKVKKPEYSFRYS